MMICAPGETLARFAFGVADMRKRVGMRLSRSERIVADVRLSGPVMDRGLRSKSLPPGSLPHNNSEAIMNDHDIAWLVLMIFALYGGYRMVDDIYAYGDRLRKRRQW